MKNNILNLNDIIEKLEIEFKYHQWIIYYDRHNNTGTKEYLLLNFYLEPLGISNFEFEMKNYKLILRQLEWQNFKEKNENNYPKINIILIDDLKPVSLNNIKGFNSEITFV